MLRLNYVVYKVDETEQEEQVASFEFEHIAKASAEISNKPLNRKNYRYIVRELPDNQKIPSCQYQ